MASEAVPSPMRSFAALGGAVVDAPQTVEERLGRYQILGELGRGGMGRVLRAFDPEIGREVAVKVLLRPHGSDPEPLERFIAEARITGQLEHPNIVPVYDVGVTEQGQVYYVMKRVAGQSLDAVLTTASEDWSLHRLLAAFVSVCAAVSFAHSRGVIHQDLKPQNIILGAFDEVLVLDWGLAALLRAGLDIPDATISSGGLGGTPGFIAPEAIRAPNAPPTPWMDQWSLGATLYTVLCGRPPYEGPTARATLDGTLAGPPIDPRLRSSGRAVPNELAELCQQAMHADPARRLPDVAALGAAVRAFLEGSQRRARALVLVAEADALAPQIQAQREEAARLNKAAEAQLVGVRGLDPIERKRAAWALQDAAAAAERAAALQQVVWEERLQGALQLSPDLHEAHVRLALHHRRLLEAAEARRDPGAASRAEWLLRQHDRGHHRRWLAGTGALTLHTARWPRPASARPRRRVGGDAAHGSPHRPGLLPHRARSPRTCLGPVSHTDPPRRSMGRCAPGGGRAARHPAPKNRGPRPRRCARACGLVLGGRRRRGPGQPVSAASLGGQLRRTATPRHQRRVSPLDQHPDSSGPIGGGRAACPPGCAAPDASHRRHAAL